MKVLIGCEFSGTVRQAFRALGHDAWSCDLLPAADESPHHMQMDVFKAARQMKFDIGIFHPPCTDLCVSGARWFPQKIADGSQAKSIKFFMDIAALKIPMTAIENPIGIMPKEYRKPDQIIQPWMFGDKAFKATCLWLKCLPLLRPQNALVPPAREQADEYKEWSAIHMAPPGPDRWKIRSKTFQGIADAMAKQWGGEP